MDITDFRVKLRNGAGNGNPQDGLCLMEAVHWFSGADVLSDRPECASPVLCALGIRLNDSAPTQEHRDSLWPLVWQLLGSRDPQKEQERTKYIVREAVHRIVAPVFDKAFPKHANALRSARTMKEIQVAARAAMAAARLAVAEADAAWEATWAADAAWEASEAAEASAEASAGAARLAVAEADAAGWGSAVEEVAKAAKAAGWGSADAAAVWEQLRTIVSEAIALGEHGEADPVYLPRALELTQVLQAVP